jgi:hypothetical protein
MSAPGDVAHQRLPSRQRYKSERISGQPADVVQASRNGTTVSRR